MQEFLFSKDALLDLINSSPDSQMIAVRINYEALGTEGNGFKATVKASAVPPADGEYESKQDQPQVFEATSTMTTKEVDGCPNPPGCK